MKEPCPHLTAEKCSHPQSLLSNGKPWILCAELKTLRWGPCGKEKE